MLELQILVIVCATMLTGFCARAIGQPVVVGEMAAGILLGPVIFGGIAPALQHRIFAADSLGGLQAIAEFGLMLFMFIVGTDLSQPEKDRGHGRKQTGDSRLVIVTATVSVAVPLLIGATCTYVLSQVMDIPAGQQTRFALFLGTAMAVTAFPVLARMLTDHALLRTPIGRIAMKIAAMIDLYAWILFAICTTPTHALTSATSVAKLVLVPLACAAAIWIARPRISAWLAQFGDDGQAGEMHLLMLAVVAAIVGAAILSRAAGLHPVLGAFAVGCCFPSGTAVSEKIRRDLGSIASRVLMPCYFALAGLNMTRDAFIGVGFTLFCVLLAIAVASKVFGTAAGARLGGATWRTGMLLGVLMNTRGLVELILLKEGLNAGVITPKLYTLMFLVALVTTALTGGFNTFFVARQRFSPTSSYAP
ncbi:cation:proton antiporter [Trinickia acidisoli]|uniref:cation:proton antiporter n=1 Tax=Trinickia acidisoli TaxID=2767482 RepID=UPI001A8DC946|nr:cation:proton antiporter [Trinickia acidisoli]